MTRKMGEAAEKFHWEFSGPYLGPVGIMFGLPLVCYALVFACNSSGCLAFDNGISFPGFPDNSEFSSIQGVQVAIAWMVLVFILHLVLPGARTQGVKLSTGSHLTYKLNGFLVMMVIYPSAVYFGFVAKTLNLSWAYDNYLALLTGSCLISFLLSFYLFVTSFVEGKLLCKGATTGRWIYDFFMGRELNPRVGSFDLKEWCELYPGLIGWTILNLAMAHKQFLMTGSVGTPMLMVNAFHLLYVCDALWFERAILTTMDITSDGFGFMLAFGDLTWVPFIYTLQCRLLVDHTPYIPKPCLATIFLIKVIGYIIFRGANGQKDQFRRDPSHPSVAHLKTLKTESGRQLIISGWWGTARHINYFGDWLMGMAWCMPCGANVVGYFYAVYFGILLIHRDGRDGHACKLKYGKDWDKYCSFVKYRIVPGIY